MDNELLIEEIRNKIFKLGSKIMWLEIEKIPNWQDRIVNRQLFFLAGGVLDEN